MPLVAGLDVGGEPCLPISARACSPHGVAARKTAILLVGASRQLVNPLVHTSYATHVLGAFGAHSRTQLFLHLGHETPRRPGVSHPLDGAIATLQPARVEVVPLTQHAQTAPPAPAFKRGAMVECHLSAARATWWGSLGSVDDGAVGREERHAFESVFVSRPDLVFTEGFGPACAYAGDVWYTAGIGSPDMLWLMPRRIAAAVLSTLHTFTTCSEDSECCRLQRSGGDGNDLRADDWAASYWPLSYWTRRLNISVSTAMLGSAKLLGSVKNRGLAHLGCGAPNCGRRKDGGCWEKTLQMSDAVSPKCPGPDWHPGYCASADSEGDCKADTKGFVALSSAAACRKFCETCWKCSFVSFSARLGDCSWYTHCPRPDALVRGTTGIVRSGTRLVQARKFRVAHSFNNPPAPSLLLHGVAHNRERVMLSHRERGGGGTRGERAERERGESDRASKYRAGG